MLVQGSRPLVLALIVIFAAIAAGCGSPTDASNPGGKPPGGSTGQWPSSYGALSMASFQVIEGHGIVSMIVQEDHFFDTCDEKLRLRVVDQEGMMHAAEWELGLATNELVFMNLTLPSDGRFIIFGDGGCSTTWIGAEGDGWSRTEFVGKDERVDGKPQVLDTRRKVYLNWTEDEPQAATWSKPVRLNPRAISFAFHFYSAVFVGNISLEEPDHRVMGNTNLFGQEEVQYAHSWVPLEGDYRFVATGAGALRNVKTFAELELREYVILDHAFTDRAMKVPDGPLVYDLQPVRGPTL